MIILVVVSLVLMAILGLSFVQIARLDRLATQGRTDNIDMVKDAVIEQIVRILADDLMDDEGKFFSGIGDTDEPYDYAWTNQNTEWRVRLRDGTLGEAKGNKFDDAWLAAAYMIYQGEEATWPKVSNLTGIRLALPLNDAAFQFPGDGQGEVVLDFTGSILSGDANIDIGTDDGLGFSDGNVVSVGADADGDNILDSYWTWAPITQIGGTSYVMAVRIVDLSALLNVNVALSQVDSSGNYDSTANGVNAPRWINPAEVNMGRFLYRRGTGGFMAELENFLNYRLGTVEGLPTPRDRREEFFLNGPAFYGGYQGNYKQLGIGNELELRHRWGLDDPDVQADIENATTGMPTFLRHGLNTESSWDDVDLGLYGGTTANMEDYIDLQPRNKLTVTSGAAIYRPPLDLDGTDGNLKVNLNDTDIDGNLKVNLNGIHDMLADVYKTDTFTPPNQFASVDDFVHQFTANIVDYADADNRLTKVGDRHGFELLPFIAEVYVQRRYAITAATEIPNPPDPSNWDVVWTREGRPGFAIEIRNPFTTPILLDDVHLFVGGSDWGELSKSDFGNHQWLDPGKTLILWRPSHGNLSPPEDTISNLWSGPDIIDWEITTSSGSEQWPNGDHTVKVELRAEDPDGNPYNWGYVVYKSRAMEITISEQVTSATDPTLLPSPVSYKQWGAIGNGNALNVLTVKTLDVVVTSKDLDLSTPYSVSGLENLGEDTKPDGVADLMSSSQLSATQFIFSDRGFLEQPGELLHVAIIGPEGQGNTFADAWHAAAGPPTGVEDFMAGFIEPQLEMVGSDNLQVSHATMLLDQFTTLSPAVDNMDNDQDGQVDEQDEQLVPGLVNLNTISPQLLGEILPIPDTDLRTRIVTQIVNYREGNRPHPIREDSDGNPYLGISYLGELMDLLHENINPGDGPDVAGPGNDALDNEYMPDTGNRTRVDFLSNPAGDQPDGVIDDREEAAMLGRWLGQVGSTRSDFFVAYVKIRGYPSSDFRLGPVESKQFYVIFDRSRITGPDDRVRVLAMRDLQ